LVVKINGNSGTQQETYDSTKVSKEIVPFQQEFPIYECDVKYDPTGHLQSESDKQIRLRLPVLLGMRLRPRLHPKTSDSGSATLHFKGYSRLTILCQGFV